MGVCVQEGQLHALTEVSDRLMRIIHHTSPHARDRVLGTANELKLTKTVLYHIDDIVTWHLSSLEQRQSLLYQQRC